MLVLALRGGCKDVLVSVQTSGVDVSLLVREDCDAWVGWPSTGGSVTVALVGLIATSSRCSAVGGNGWKAAVML
jgi:predicted S18 family serine protease